MAPPRLATGRIVWAELADANGVRKVRPAVIVAPTDQIVAGKQFDVIAVTSRLTDPLPDVLLPWHAQGHPRTGLNRRCAAVCSWPAQIKDSDIQDVAGLVPTPLMTAILGKLAAASAPPPISSPGSGGGTPAPPRSPAVPPQHTSKHASTDAGDRTGT
ncbi:MAG TPA: hypothetical protein VGY66_37250 [Gemmataceae bacterium]|nr:hypothetical protein [Gemmataceae bacterium]